jgi:hypothetical protein
VRQRKGCRVSVDFRISNIRELIEEKRKELIQLGTCKPLTDPEVVKLSQRLDQLLNEYEFLKHNYRYVLEYMGA